MKSLLGTKVGMTQVFTKEGKAIPTTVIYVEPNKVLDVRTQEKDGYTALQVGYKTVKDKNVTKPKMGQFKKAKCEPKRFIREFRDMTGYTIGQEFGVEIFEQGQYISAQAKTKGHGFTGSIKRHNFSIGPMGHGAGYPHRYVGSISGGRGGSQAQRVFKGTKLPGHYGHETVTTSNLLVLDVMKDKNLILIKGAVPGPKGMTILLKETLSKVGKIETINLVNNTATKKATSEPKA